MKKATPTTTKEAPKKNKKNAATFKTIQKGHCFELHKITDEEPIIVFVQANTTLKKFTAACKRYKK